MPPVVPSLLDLSLQQLAASIDRYEGLGDLPEELALQLLEVRRARVCVAWGSARPCLLISRIATHTPHSSCSLPGGSTRACSASSSRPTTSWSCGASRCGALWVTALVVSQRARRRRHSSARSPKPHCPLLTTHYHKQTGAQHPGPAAALTALAQPLAGRPAGLVLRQRRA